MSGGSQVVRVPGNVALMLPRRVDKGGLPTSRRSALARLVIVAVTLLVMSCAIIGGAIASAPASVEGSVSSPIDVLDGRSGPSLQFELENPGFASPQAESCASACLEPRDAFAACLTIALFVLASIRPATLNHIPSSTREQPSHAPLPPTAMPAPRPDLTAMSVCIR